MNDELLGAGQYLSIFIVLETSFNGHGSRLHHFVADDTANPYFSFVSFHIN
jgi:hypothetical protein